MPLSDPATLQSGLFSLLSNLRKNRFRYASCLTLKCHRFQESLPKSHTYVESTPEPRQGAW